MSAQPAAKLYDPSFPSDEHALDPSDTIDPNVATHLPHPAIAPPPGASQKLHAAASRLRGPVEHFLHMETASGIVLLITGVVALLWANSAWAHSYHDLWHAPVAFGIGSLSVTTDLHFIINDGLMTIFFLVVGLEIKRELVEGELSDFKRASLPVAAAFGGMVVPAMIFFAINTEAPASNGWGVPMATDIAFAVGILSLLGKRVPSSLRILLLALAIIDDLGAILVIAFFYPTGTPDPTGFWVAGGGVMTLLVWRQLGLRPGPLYLVPMGILWVGFFKAGVHPTMAGVIVGLATPVRAWLSGPEFVSMAQDALKQVHAVANKPGHNNSDLVDPVRSLSFAAKEALSPVVRGVSEMHIWVSFAIMPLFALANAGVSLGGVSFSGPQSMGVFVGVALGLALGKPAGVMLAAWLAVRSGIASLPHGLKWRSILVLGMAAGIGFTMAIFVAELAFTDPALKSISKLSILAATGVAAIAALVSGRLLLKPVPNDVSPTEAERSTEY